MTIVYLIRHSLKIGKNIIDYSNEKLDNNESFRAQIILSCEGEKRAERLSNINEFQDIDIIYSSNNVRTIQTAKYLAEKKNLQIHIDSRFNERNLGINGNDELYINQYWDDELKAENGENKREITTRMFEAFQDVVNKNKNKKIAIFSHGASMSFLLMKWCKLENITMNKCKTLSFNGKIIYDKIFDAPEAFKIVLDDDNEVINVENIDLEAIK